MADNSGENATANKDEVAIIRQLTESEESKWLDMVVYCYAVKGTPREVFENHLRRTPPNERILLAALDKSE